MKAKKKPLFEEKQKFRQPWLWLILLGVTALLFYEMYEQFIVDNAAIGSDPVLLIFTGLIGVGLPISFYIAKLITRVYPDSIGIRFYPLHWKEHHYPLNQIESVEVVTYRPLLDYGGWGIRISPSGKAYNVSGNRGVQLTFSNGRPLLIGSRKPGELADALEQATGKTDS